MPLAPFLELDEKIKKVVDEDACLDLTKRQVKEYLDSYFPHLDLQPTVLKISISECECDPDDYDEDEYDHVCYTDFNDEDADEWRDSGDMNFSDLINNGYKWQLWKRDV